MTEQVVLHLIYLRSNEELLLSKKPYLDWREIQEEYEDYMASLGPWSEEDVVDFFRTDWGENEAKWPFSADQIHDFIISNRQVLQLKSPD